MFGFIRRWLKKRQTTKPAAPTEPREAGYTFPEFPNLDLSLPGAYMPASFGNPEVELKITSEEIRALPDRKLKATWAAEIDSGWPLYFIPLQVADLLTWQQKYDERAWQRDAKGEPQPHQKIRFEDIHEGLIVIWKGNPCDYEWDAGVIVKRDGIWYVESPDNQCHWGVVEYSVPKGCWVNNGACYVPNMPIFDK